MSVAFAAKTFAPLPDTVKVRRRLGAMMLLVMIAAGALALFVWAAMSAPRAPKIWFVGPFYVAFFGWALVRFLWRIFSSWTMTIGSGGFTIPSWSFQSRLVRWIDVETIDAVEASVYTKGFFRAHPTWVGVRLAPPAAGLAEFADKFARNRSAYGYDILLARLDIDRDPGEFAAYLNSYRRRYTPDTIHA